MVFRNAIMDLIQDSTSYSGLDYHILKETFGKIPQPLHDDEALKIFCGPKFTTGSIP